MNKISLTQCSFNDALADQPKWDVLNSLPVQGAAAFLVVLGLVFVLSSMWALGITGTYLGDYFGILMDARVTGFPFNVLENPMYIGSTMNFLGISLWYGTHGEISLLTRHSFN